VQKNFGEESTLAVGNFSSSTTAFHANIMQLFNPLMPELNVLCDLQQTKI
jgi:hypothetical protein